MSDIETRLREAFRADAETVQTIRPLTTPGQRGTDDARPRGQAGRTRRGHILIPLTAAAAVAAILAGIAVAAPRIWPGHGQRAPIPASAIAASFPGNRVPAASAPKFLLALVPKRPGNALRLETVSARTGHVIARLRAPAPHRYYAAAAPLGNNRTFMLAAVSTTSCRTWFYQVTFNAQGRAASVPTIAAIAAGQVSGAHSIAVSANGRLLAYSAADCHRGYGYYGRVSMVNLKTGATKAWRFRWPAAPGSLSLSADGSVLEMVSNPSNGARASSPAYNRAWVLRTNSPPGVLERHYRRVFGPNPCPIAAVLSPSARLIWALIGTYHRPAPHWTLRLSGYESATGKLAGDRHVFPPVDEIGPDTLTADVSGRYVLFANGGSPLRWVDLATGRVVTIPGRAANLPLDVAW